MTHFPWTTTDLIQLARHTYKHEVSWNEKQIQQSVPVKFNLLQKKKRQEKNLLLFVYKHSFFTTFNVFIIYFFSLNFFHPHRLPPVSQYIYWTNILPYKYLPSTNIYTKKDLFTSVYEFSSMQKYFNFNWAVSHTRIRWYTESLVEYICKGISRAVLYISLDIFGIKLNITVKGIKI